MSKKFNIPVHAYGVDIEKLRTVIKEYDEGWPIENSEAEYLTSSARLLLALVDHVDSVVNEDQEEDHNG